jgi:hypothetical protein
MRSTPIRGNTIIGGFLQSSNAVPGADQAVMIGCFSHQLNVMPDTDAPIEIAQTHVART